MVTDQQVRKLIPNQARFMILAGRGAGDERRGRRYVRKNDAANHFQHLSDENTTHLRLSTGRRPRWGQNLPVTDAPSWSHQDVM